MAIIHTYKMYKGRSGDRREDSSRGYEEEWVVLTDTLLDDAAVLLNDPALPAAFSQANNDPNATLRNVRAEQFDDNPWLWRVRFSYDSKLEDNNQSQGNNPLDWNPKITRTATVIKKAVTEDIDGEKILNKAKRAYDPPLEIDVYCPTVKIQRVEPYFSNSAAWSTIGTVNSSAWAGAPERSVILTTWDGESFYHTLDDGTQVLFWNVTYEVIHNPFGWDPKVLEQGYCDKNGKRILDDDNKQPVSEPYPLNSSGMKGDPNSPIFTTWKILKESNFSSLGIEHLI